VSLATRLMAAMVGLVILTATIIGFLTLRNIEAVAVPRALDHVDARARLLAAELEASVRGARADIAGFRSAAAVEGIVRASAATTANNVGGMTLEEWRTRLARRFVAELAAKPSYGQFRVIGVADGGREIIRVDRSGPDGTIRVVPDAELQRKGDRDYFMRAVRLSGEGVYVSPIELNQENGAIEVPHVPVLRVAAPIMDLDGGPFGAIVIIVDLRPAFSRIRTAAARTGDLIYVANERGDYLVHPTPNREFAFEFGKSPRIQEDFPEINHGLAEHRIVRDSTGQRYAAAGVPVQLAQGPWVSLIAMVPYSQVLAANEVGRTATLVAGLIAVLLAIALAAVITRSLTRPIAQMTKAVEAFRRGVPMLMPTDARGEIGLLADAFQRLGTDVRDKAEALAKETEERRRIFETSLDLILTTDRPGRFLQVSPSCATILGYKPSEMVGRSIEGIVAPHDLDAMRKEMLLARNGHQIRKLETRCLHADGRAVTMVWSGVWSEPEQRFFFIGRDMTEQTLVEEKFRLAVEASPSGMLMTDADGKILMVNAETEKQFGYSRAELIGQSIDMLVPVRFRNKHPDHRKTFTDSPGVRTMGAGRDLFGLRKNATEFPVEVGLNPIRTRDGLVILSVVVDITERIRNERLRRDFVATVSHELRTPLTSIAGSLGLLDGGALGSVPDGMKRLLRIALDNSRRLTRLINDILDIEKLEAGKMNFSLRRTDVKALVTQAIEANAAFADAFGVKARLADDAVDADVNADPDRLMQVFINLLSNAAKFSPAGRDVSVSIGTVDDRVQIGVRDHGPGIPEEFKDRIFEKFAQSDNTDSRRRGGTGLGLSIVRQIVTRLGGTISYEAASGGGTVFIVDLPQWNAATKMAAAE
jgi:PAS domain S-box-containing protein